MAEVVNNLQNTNKQGQLNKNDMYIDMHTHSIFSDGELTPRELIKKAIESNIGTIVITDHDTILGNKNIFENINTKERELLTIISGIELTVKMQKGRMHILGYDYDINDISLNNKMQELRNNSLYSVLGILTQLKKDYNIIFDYEDIKDIINKEGNIGRPHIAKLLIKYGFVQSVKEAFDKYLVSAQKNAQYSKKGITYEECISLINNAGGIAVLAHPNQLKMDDDELEVTLQKLISCGLAGIEVYHSNHSKEEVEKYLYLATKYNLLISGGSDYHGEGVKPDIKLGKGINSNVKIKKLSLVEYIKERNK